MLSNNNFLVVKEEIYHLIEINRMDSAITKIEDLLSIEPNNEELLFLKAVCLYQKGNLTDALILCKEAMGLGFLAERCHYLLAKISYDKHEYIEAEEHYIEALRLTPQEPDIIADYGELMFETGHEKKAFELIDEALRLDPYNGNALDFYIRYNLSTNNKLAHAEVLQRYMDSSDSELSKLTRIGLSQIMSKNYKEARETFRQAYLMNPANKEILLVLEDLVVNSNPYFLPIQLAEKIGGPKVIWLGFIILALILRALHLDVAMIVVVIIYISYAVYTWTTIPVRKYLERKIKRG